MNSLAHQEAFTVLARALEHYAHAGRWWVEVFLAMPDHCHALVTFPDPEAMPAVVRDWKRYVAKQAGVRWQNGFFDHRLRSTESRDEKWHYIALNPVRKGLCAQPEDWPWVWNCLEGTRRRSGALGAQPAG